MKVYGIITPNTTKVLFTANELGLDIDYELVNVFAGEHKSPEHIARNPYAKVPVLEHDGRYLFESAAICRYLADSVPGNTLYPSDDPWRRAIIDQWVDNMVLHTAANVHKAFLEKKVLPGFLGRPVNEATIAYHLGLAAQELPIVDRYLSDNEFLGGEHLSIADTIGFPMMLGAKAAGIDLGDFPSLKRWFDALAQRPTVAPYLAEFKLPIEL
jgi:glutathione S-transferase